MHAETFNDHFVKSLLKGLSNLQEFWKLFNFQITVRKYETTWSDHSCRQIINKSLVITVSLPTNTRGTSGVIGPSPHIRKSSLRPEIFGCRFVHQHRSYTVIGPPNVAFQQSGRDTKPQTLTQLKRLPFDVLMLVAQLHVFWVLEAGQPVLDGLRLAFHLQNLTFLTFSVRTRTRSHLPSYSRARRLNQYFAWGPTAPDSAVCGGSRRVSWAGPSSDSPLPRSLWAPPSTRPRRGRRAL